MTYIGLATTVLILCTSCVERAQPRETRALIPEVKILHVQCVAKKSHPMPYTVWEIHLWRTIDSGKNPDVTMTYLTSSASDPTVFPVEYKLLDSGMVYVAIGGLDSLFAVGPHGKVHSNLQRAEYDAANAGAIKLRVLEKYSIEVNERQYPLLPTR